MPVIIILILSSMIQHDRKLMVLSMNIMMIITFNSKLSSS